MEKIIEKILDVLTIISDGGPKAIVAIMFAGLALVITANFFLLKFMIKFFEKMNEVRDKLVSEKDKVISDSIAKTEAFIKQYHEALKDNNEAIRKIESELHDINVLTEAYFSNKHNNRRNRD